MTPSPIHILLVDDDPGDVLLTKEALRNSKLRNSLDVVSNGQAALQYLRRQNEFADCPRPDLVLLDLNMPIMDGRETLEAIKSDPGLKTLPVVVLTTSDADQDVVKSYELNASCYITKPVDLEQFTKVVHTIRDFWFCVVSYPGR